MTSQFAPTDTGPTPRDPGRPQDRRLDTSGPATARRTLRDALLVVLLVLGAHAATATAPSLAVLAVIALVGLGIAAAGEADRRWHPRHLSPTRYAVPLAGWARPARPPIQRGGISDAA